MPSDDDRRQSFRITETAFVNHETIDDETFDKGIARWRLRSAAPTRIRTQLIDIDARLAELVFLAGNESSAIGEVLRLLNDKINIIAHALPEFRDAERRLADKRPRPCQLSSEGMSFGTDEELAKDTKVVLQWLVEPDNRFFESFARVVRTTPMDDRDMGPFGFLTAVKFHGMSPAEREFLIQHLFTRQSEDLRLRRKENDRQEPP